MQEENDRRQQELLRKQQRQQELVNNAIRAFEEEKQRQLDRCEKNIALIRRVEAQEKEKGNQRLGFASKIVGISEAWRRELGQFRVDAAPGGSVGKINEQTARVRQLEAKYMGQIKKVDIYLLQRKE